MESGMSEVIIRRATLSDVEAMHRLVNHFADEGWMLPKSRNTLYQNIRDFVVAEVDEQFAGCGALHIVWGDLGEIRSLAVEEQFQKEGVGWLIVSELLADARALNLPRIFALTYQEQKSFFERMGFVEVAKSTMPQKVWGECMDCPKFPDCDEIAMILEMEGSE